MEKKIGAAPFLNVKAPCVRTTLMQARNLITENLIKYALKN